MITLLIIIVLIELVIIIKLLGHDTKNADLANQNFVAVNHNALLVFIVQRLLVKHLGAKQAAIALLDEVEKTPDAYPILKQLQERSGLNDPANIDPKTRKITLRTLTLGFQNMKDLMEDETDAM